MTNQIRFLTAIAECIRAIDDPEPEVIRHISYTWRTQNIKGFGIIPKLTFTPYGQSTKIKADIMRSAGLQDQHRQKEIDEIRERYSPKKAKDHEDRILARLFESYWNSYWQTIFRALRRIEQAQRIFAKPTETISKPMRILLGKRAINSDQKFKTPESPESREHKPYSAILAELE
jgi:hypothetical protein